MTQNENNQAEDLIQFIWNKRKLLILITLIAAIAAAVYSLLIQEKFKSTVTLYPAMSNTVAFTDEVHPEQSAAQFGEEEQAEQMIQVLQSAEIRNSIIEKYKLMEHYEIDTSSKIKYTALNKNYEENVSFSRTKYGSVLIEVMDKKPQMAADIANDIANLFDNAKNRMINERSKEAFEVAESERNKLGVVDKETRPTLITALANAKDGGTKILIQEKIKATDKFGSIYSNFENKLEWMNIRLSTKDAVYEQLKSDANSTFSHKFTVEKASVSEKKAYPIRWLIVVVSTISAFLFAIVLLLVFEKVKDLKRKES
jgi:tyrosine-protein kinase Etk/Wzc